MRFPVKVAFRKAEAKIYGKSEAYPFYRVCYYAAGKRHVRSFSTYSEAKAEADKKVREIADGTQAIALTDKEASCERLPSAATDFGFLMARNSSTASEINFGLSVASVRANTLTDSVSPQPGGRCFMASRKPVTASSAVKLRPVSRLKASSASRMDSAAVSACYTKHVECWMREFAAAFPGHRLGDLSREFLARYMAAQSELSPKTRNDRRAAVAMFLRWCVRQDYLSPTHRLLEADAMQKEQLRASGHDLWSRTNRKSLPSRFDLWLSPNARHVKLRQGMSLQAFIRLKFLMCVLLMQTVVSAASLAQEAATDPVKKFTEVKSKADNGDAEAQYMVGAYYEHGFGVATDAVEAVKWYRKAAEQGHAAGQTFLAYCYLNGVGVPTNALEAVKWFRKSAEQGDGIGESGLGDCYAFGVGVPTNKAEAIKWYRKSAEQGEAFGEEELGYAYFIGLGVATNYVEAYKWLRLAAIQGLVYPQQSVNILEQQMTLEQIAEAQELIRQFKPSKPESMGTAFLPESVIGSRPAATGTGFFITDDGYLISNAHVVKNATQVRLVTSAGFVSAKVVQVDFANDLALLKAEGHFLPLPVASSKAMKLGDTVATVGFPDIGLQGFSPKLAKGEIASLLGVQDDPRYFQISVPVQPGNSGGALVDESGNVVGIVAAKLNASAALAATGALPENVNYAIKSSFLLSFLKSVPEVSAKLRAPPTSAQKFGDVVQSAQAAAVLVLCY